MKRKAEESFEEIFRACDKTFVFVEYESTEENVRSSGVAMKYFLSCYRKYFLSCSLKILYDIFIFFILFPQDIIGNIYFFILFPQDII